MRGLTVLNPIVVIAASLAGCEAPHEPLVEQLQSTSAESRRAAALALGKLGSTAEPAVSSLWPVVGDGDPTVRQAACRALGEIGVASLETTAALQPALDDAELSVRLAAAIALLRLDPSGDVHRQVLTDAMLQGEGGTIVAVGRLEPKATWALPTLTQLLRDRRPGIRRIAAEALGRIGPDAAAREALHRSATQDADDRVRTTATESLSATQ